MFNICILCTIYHKPNWNKSIITIIVIWWWLLGWSEGWVPDSTDTLGSEVKIKPTHEDDTVMWYFQQKFPSLSCHWLNLGLKSMGTISKNGFSFRLNPGYQKMLQNCLETDQAICKCNKTTKFVAYYQIKSSAFF